MKTGFILNFFLTFLMFSSQFNSNYRPDQITFELTDLVVYYTFAESINFDARINPSENISSIQEIYISITSTGQSSAFELINWNGSDMIHFAYDASKLEIMPFTEIEYQFLFILKNKTEIHTPVFTFTYADNRFVWHELINDYFEIYWNHSDIEIGQMVLDISHEGYQAAKRYIPANLTEKIKVYIYSNKSDLQNALQLTQQSWVAGHANPDIHTIMISAPDTGPENKLEMQRQIPHEIAHILTYEITGEKYNHLPLWLIEGLASVSEIYPSPDYERVLTEAANNMDLLPISSLCVSFPYNGQQAYLAYAESSSFTRYLYKSYGIEQMQELLAIYMQGIGCEKGVEQVFGKTMAQMEFEWQQEFLGIHSELQMIKNLFPYLLLLMILVIAPISPGIIHMVKMSRNSGKEVED